MPETVQMAQPQHEPSRFGEGDARAKVLGRIAVTEHRMDLAGVPTAVLVGGDGPPIVLLHGPGESSLWWARVLPDLLQRHRVIVPDMPGHGDSGIGARRLDREQVTAWMDALVARTCGFPPVVAGHALGGAVAARYAIARPDNVARLVLVDSLGLRTFRPRLGFGFRLLRFLAKPSRTTYEPFLDQCMFDAKGLEQGMGPSWQAFLDYYLDDIRGEDSKKALPQMMRRYGLPRISRKELAGLSVPTTLIWGRQDRATPIRVAEKASARYGWPLHVIESCGDDPKLERPKQFLAALDTTLAS